MPATEKGTTIFNRLIASYKGKIVFVEYWNPRTYYKGTDLESVKKRRNKFKNNKDIIFLNITCEDLLSAGENELSIVKNGFEKSIRITKDEEHYLRRLFKFDGSMKHIIVSPEGKILRDYDGIHQLSSVLKEYFNIVPNN